MGRIDRNIIGESGSRRRQRWCTLSHIESLLFNRPTSSTVHGCASTDSSLIRPTSLHLSSLRSLIISLIQMFGEVVVIIIISLLHDTIPFKLLKLALTLSRKRPVFIIVLELFIIYKRCLRGEFFLLLNNRLVLFWYNAVLKFFQFLLQFNFGGQLMLRFVSHFLLQKLCLRQFVWVLLNCRIPLRLNKLFFRLVQFLRKIILCWRLSFKSGALGSCSKCPYSIIIHFFLMQL